MSTTGVPECVVRYFELMNADRWDEFGDVWNEDAQHAAPGAGSRQGRETIVEFYRHLFDLWDEHDDRPTRYIVAEDGAYVTVEVTYVGKLEDGRDMTFEAIDTIEVRDGRIAKLVTWYDSGLLRKLLLKGAS
jgi:ketosteroid isomerase-like protein